MLAQEIQKLVEAETAGLETNSHGWHFRSCLLSEPELCELKDHSGAPFQAWVLLRESDNGYSVVFDPDQMEFGLASSGVVISFYSSFVETLNAM
jgi:hypothetical protein